MIRRNSKLHRNGGYVYGKKEFVLLSGLIISCPAINIIENNKIALQKNTVKVQTLYYIYYTLIIYVY